MCGPGTDWYQFCYTWFCIVGVCTPYLLFVCPELYDNVSPAIPIIITLLFFSTLLFLCLTSITEPGIIPRKPIFEFQGGVPPLFSNPANLDLDQEI